MSGKSRTRKHTPLAISPLLRALTFSQAAHEPVTQTVLLRCYTGLDAFRRGHGSRELFATLGRHLLVVEELCHLGYHREEVADIHEAHAAMVHLDAAENEEGAWLLDDTDYARLCVAFELFGRQLFVASLDDIAKAEARMLEGLLKVGQARVLA